MRLIACLLLSLLASSLAAQSSHDASVDLTAAVQPSPARITLNWNADANATSHSVYRRLWGSTTWGAAIANLAASAVTYQDNSVSVGVTYEYGIGRPCGAYTAWGFITAGIQVPAKEGRGKLVLLVDDTMATPLASELTQLAEDLVCDGWQVLRHDVSRTGTAVATRAVVLADYNADPTNVKAVLIIGHVPVPYSGNMNPDGHSDHVGAWPADCYYGEMTGGWTDSTVNNVSSAQARNHNVPGDGKFDQTYLPSPLELMVGRVDLANMSSFTQTETQLLQGWLNRHHEFVTAQFRPQERAVIDDNFGYFGGEAFAASAWRSFAPMVGPANVTAGDFITSTTTGSYLWAYGCGGGTYTSAGGVGTTANIAAASLQVPFTCLFGSYHGDWDSNNNFMRSPLGSGALTCAWSGRPWWYFHSMGMGEPIGASFLETSNAPPLNGFANNMVHVGLMGSPTLRLRYIAPATAPGATQNGANVDITWTASTDSVDGYHVYRSTTAGGPYTRLTNSLVTGNTYTDTGATAGTSWYMVRAGKLQQVPSGSYHDLATGTLTSITVTGLPPTINSHPANQSVAEGQTATFSVSANNAISYQWQLNGSDITGADSSSYTTPTLTLLDNGGLYSCIVSNATGDTPSNAATLTVTVGGPGGGGSKKGGSGGGGGGCAIDTSSGAALLLWLLITAIAIIKVASPSRR